MLVIRLTRQVVLVYHLLLMSFIVTSRLSLFLMLLVICYSFTLMRMIVDNSIID